MSWGPNNQGELGDGCTIGVDCTGRTSAGLVTGLTEVLQISQGSGHSLALMTDGTLNSWGRNFRGQLGTANCTPTVDCDPTSTPTTVNGLNNVVSIHAGDGLHTVVLVSDLSEGDLETAVAGPETIVINQPFSYTLTVTNQGPEPANSVTLTNVLPGNMVAGSVTPDQGSCANEAPVVTCDLGNLSVLGSAQVDISLTAGGSPAILFNHTQVKGLVEDTFAGNNVVVPKNGYSIQRYSRC